MSQSFLLGNLKMNSVVFKAARLMQRVAASEEGEQIRNLSDALLVNMLDDAREKTLNCSNPTATREALGQFLYLTAIIGARSGLLDDPSLVPLAAQGSVPPETVEGVPIPPAPGVKKTTPDFYG